MCTEKQLVYKLLIILAFKLFSGIFAGLSVHSEFRKDAFRLKVVGFCRKFSLARGYFGNECIYCWGA